MRQWFYRITPEHANTCAVSRVVVIALLLGSTMAGLATSGQAESVENPHGTPAKCASCHVSSEAGRGDLRFEGNVIELCKSCHNGRLAASEAHRAGSKPSAEMAKRIPSDFPSENGVLDCLSCHDMSGHCLSEQKGISLGRYFLRGGRGVESSVSFCFLCHAREGYTLFNVHDQLEAGKVKVETCAWCHPVDASSKPEITDAAFSRLFGKSHDVCDNCHRVEASHPVGTAHMHVKPSEEMTFYISAYEMRDKMRTPFPRLLEYVRAARRLPRSIPFDENGAVTCYTCHNPHEKGVLPKGDPRALGAEPKKAVRHRFRAREGNMCIVCHDK